MDDNGSFYRNNGYEIAGIAETPITIRGDSAYAIVEGPTWEEAEANANKLGGHLVTINDEEENQWLYSNFGGGNWIGITDKDTEGDWKWISGDDVDYTNWYQGQPSNSIHLSTGIDQDYGWIHTDWLGEWDDHFASNDVGTSATHGIVEIKIGETTTFDSSSGNSGTSTGTSTGNPTVNIDYGSGSGVVTTPGNPGGSPIGDPGSGGGEYGTPIPLSLMHI